MRKVYYALALVLAAAAGCGRKAGRPAEDARRAIFQIDSVDRVTGVQRMQVSRVEQEISCNGEKYVLFIERAPGDSLPAVTNDMGTFADNRIVVRIARADGGKVFGRTFTRQDFSGWVEEDDLRRFILEGMVFDEEKTAAGRSIVLSASISYPQTDLYIPFSVAISPEGKMNVSRNEDAEGAFELSEGDFHE